MVGDRYTAYRDSRRNANLEVRLLERLGRRIEQFRGGLVLRLLERLDHGGEQHELGTRQVRRRQLQQQVVDAEVRVCIAQVGEATGASR